MGIFLTKSADLLKFAPPVDGERRTANLKFKPASAAELKALGEDLPDGYVAGWASTDDLDLYRHKVMRGAFSESIQERGLTGPRGIKLLIGHNWNQVAGVIKVLEYRGSRLWIEAQLNLNIGYAKDAYEAAKMVGGLSFSVGFMLEKYAVEGDEENGEWLRIDKGDLFEVSVVPFPGNEEATMTFIKNADSVAGFEKIIVKFLADEGITIGRNLARRLTQVVKANAALFQKGPADPASLPAPENAPPVLAVEKVRALSDALAKARELLETPARS